MRRPWWRTEPDARDTVPSELMRPESVRVVITPASSGRPIERTFKVSDGAAFIRHVNECRVIGKPLLVQSETAYLYVPADVLTTCVIEVSLL